ncbi:MAG: hypothetical protein R3B96_25500 [Pirellulaceae bacterium]
MFLSQACAIPVDGVVDPDQSARTVAGGNGKVQLTRRVARGESREGLGLPTSALAVVAALTLIVVSFTWGRTEGWRSGWQARSSRIAAAGEWGRPSDAGRAAFRLGDPGGLSRRGRRIGDRRGVVAARMPRDPEPRSRCTS